LFLHFFVVIFPPCLLCLHPVSPEELWGVFISRFNELY
jgi:hypothetical protein